MIKNISPVELRKMLNEGVVTFQYKKKNGEIRTATGTVNSDLITTPVLGGSCPPKEVGYSIYFDLDKGEFRCYNEAKLIGVVEG